MPPTLYGRRPMRTLEDRYANRSALAPETLPQRAGMPQVQPTLLGADTAPGRPTVQHKWGRPAASLGAPSTGGLSARQFGTQAPPSRDFAAEHARRTAAVQPIIDEADQMLALQGEMIRRGLPLSRESAKARNDYYTPSLLGPQGPVEGEAGMLSQYRDQQRVAGSGPYDSQSALSRFNGLAGAPAIAPQTGLAFPKQGTRYSGGSTVDRPMTSGGVPYLVGTDRPSPGFIGAQGRAADARASGSAFVWSGRNEQVMDSVARRAAEKNGIDPNLPPEQRNASLREAAIARHAGEKQQRLAHRRGLAGRGGPAYAQSSAAPNAPTARALVPTVTEGGQTTPDTSAAGFQQWMASLETSHGDSWDKQAIDAIRSGDAPWNMDQAIAALEEQQADWEDIGGSLAANFSKSQADQLEREKNRINRMRTQLGLEPWEPSTALYPEGFNF